jgi:hypothetical protein
MKCELSAVAAQTDCQGFLSGREDAIALKFHAARRLTIKAWDALRASKGSVALISGLPS